jgi:hypothetical protein
MLIGPPVTHAGFREWIKIPLPFSAISACRWCDQWLQVTYHGGQVMLGRNWPVAAYKYDMKHDNLLEFKIKAFGLKINIYKHNSSSAKTYVCPSASRQPVGVNLSFCLCK